MKNLDGFYDRIVLINVSVVGNIMKKLDESNLDIRHLQMFVAVMRLGNMTQAANMLNIKQSTISHAIDKLRTIFGDPLFIRSGRGITSTPRADELLPEIEALLAHYHRLKRPPEFNPADAEIVYTIAANDFLRDEIIPVFYHHLYPLVSRLKLTIIPADLPNLILLQEDKADMVISSFRPDSNYIMSRRLFNTHDLCFYDSKQRNAPKTIQDYASADYICPAVIVDSCQMSLPDEKYKKPFMREKTVLNTPSFASAAKCLSHTTALSIAPVQLKDSLFDGFAYTELPYDSSASIYLQWHRKNQNSRKHYWVRQQLFYVIQKRFSVYI